MGTLTTICACCGTAFEARSVLAVYCSVNCKARAAYYRRTGRPVPPTKLTWERPEPIRPEVLQPTILAADDGDDELPAAWDAPPPAGVDQRIWQGTAIQRRQSDGFVNATAMCKANGKHLPHYTANERTRQYLQALSGSVGIPTDRLTVAITTGPNDLRGTWIHPRLAVDLARWISPAFAVWMDGWFLESLTRPAAPAMRPGIHVVASTRRDACRIWHEAIQAEVRGALAKALSPDHRHDRGLPAGGRWQWALPSEPRADRFAGAPGPDLLGPVAARSAPVVVHAGR